MAYFPQVFDNFGAGLNLKSKADAVGPGEAIDCKNVVFTDRGAVQQRPGWEALTASELTNHPDSLHPFYTTSGTAQLLAGCGTRLEAISTAGAVVASSTGLTSTGSPWYWDFCRFGTPNSELAYAGNGEQVLQKWNGSAWSSVSNTPQAGALCVTPTSNRMVATRFKGTTGGPTGGASTSSPSHVYFSDAGAPETWTSTNYVQLDPGDGEAIQACIAWREYVFVFKETKFFVFTGESTSSSGSPIFNYRKVDTGVGMAGRRAVAANEAGVYFANREGVYITTGAEPAKLSEPIDPIFLGNSDEDYSSLAFDPADAADMAVGIWQDLLLVRYGDDGSSTQTAVYHTQDGWWSAWTGVGHCFGLFRPDDLDELVFSIGGSDHIFHMDGSATTEVVLTDTVRNISSYWRGGFHDLGSPEIKKIRQFKAWGSGKVQADLTRDYESTVVAPANSLDFTAVATNHLNPVLARTSSRGTTFSLYLTHGTSTSAEGWSVHRVEYHIAGARQPTVTRTD